MEGRFCRLEPLQVDSHLDDLYQANAFDKDGRSWTYLAYGPFSDKDSYRDWITRTCLSEDPLFFAIVDKGVGSACGVASYVNIESSGGAIEVGHIHYSPQVAADANSHRIYVPDDEEGIRIGLSTLFVEMRQSEQSIACGRSTPGIVV